MEALHTRTPSGERKDYDVTPTLAIDQALALLGVHLGEAARDEFEAIGLDRHRWPRDWIAEAR
jgi:hypothetical protein